MNQILKYLALNNLKKVFKMPLLISVIYISLYNLVRGLTSGQGLYESLVYPWRYKLISLQSAVNKDNMYKSAGGFDFIKSIVVPMRIACNQILSLYFFIIIVKNKGVNIKLTTLQKSLLVFLLSINAVDDSNCG